LQEACSYIKNGSQEVQGRREALVIADYRSQVFPERHDQHDCASDNTDSEQGCYESQEDFKQQIEIVTHESIQAHVC